MFVVSAIRNKSNYTLLEDKILMCKECLQPFYRKNTVDELCPKCGISLEELEGFYERHPELKNGEL